MHVLPQLRRLEERYPEELVVLGVHSAKFPPEREEESLRKAVIRYDIRHPVANDRDLEVWRRYAVRAWPTLFLVDPQGLVLGKHEGEVTFEAFDRVIGRVVQEYDRRGLLRRGRIVWPLEREKEAAGRPVAFPGKVLADAASGRLFIADSGHHRVLVATLDGEVRQVVGDGTPGLQDGALASARFRTPQGMALEGDLLYVADTENHAVRRVDLAAGRVETVAGTGQMATASMGAGPAREVPLRSPWDVAAAGGLVYLAMAGTHQLWALDPRAGVIRPFAGSGHEGLRDGPRSQAWLAQPSGLAVGNGRLFFADSETSAVRHVGLDDDGEVRTLVGIDLFDFGDVDGVGEEVRLQHPLGVAWANGVLYVADTYNSKVKRLDPETRECRTLFGDGGTGLRDGTGTEARLFEPGGLSAANGRLYVADTNNHVIRVAHLAAGRLETLEVRGV